MDGQTWTVVAALAGAVSTLAGLLYKTLLDRIAELEGEVAELRRQAQATTEAKNRELDEWKRLALDRTPAR